MTSTPVARAALIAACVVGFLLGFVVGFVGPGAPWLFLIPITTAVVVAAVLPWWRAVAVAMALGVVAGIAFLFFAGAADIFESVP